MHNYTEMNTTSTYICSQHFKASDFLEKNNNNNNTLGEKKHLKYRTSQFKKINQIWGVW